MTAVFVVGLLILVNAFYVAAEFATVSVRRSRIRQLAEAGDAQARLLLPVLDDGRLLDRYVAACQIGITLSSLLLGAYGQWAFARPLQGFLHQLGPWREGTTLPLAAGLVLVLLTVLQVVLGELVPKSLALQYTTGTALHLTRPMFLSIRLFGPFNGLLNGSGMAVLRLLGLQQTSHRHIHSPEEIDMLLVDSRDGGQLEPDEQQRLHQGLTLSLRTAEDMMVPRLHVAIVDVDAPPATTLRCVLDSPYTRLPACRGDLDHVAGILHTKDLVIRQLTDETPVAVAPLLHPPVYVPETMTGDKLLATFRQQRSHMALVVDEFGGVAGLVTLEDVLEELIGQLGEPLRHGQPAPQRLPDGRIRLPGLLRLDEAAAWIGSTWHGEAHTIGGHIADLLGHIPEPGERLEIEGSQVEVEAVAHHAVQAVLVQPAPGQRHG